MTILIMPKRPQKFPLRSQEGLPFSPDKIVKPARQQKQANGQSFLTQLGRRLSRRCLLEAIALT
jgi:hypothetical protein